jgi:hypothetical protein
VAADNGGGGGLASSLKAWLGVGVTVVALASGLIALDQGWFKRGKERQCQMSGTVTLAFGSPAGRVRLGFQPADGSDDFVQLTRSNDDGTFSASCEAARNRTTGSSFELLANGNAAGGPLPCLGPPERTGVLVDREGESTGLSLEIRGC